jgi:hypothetical protein
MKGLLAVAKHPGPTSLSSVHSKLNFRKFFESPWLSQRMKGMP